jgi:hypothetical protein
MSKLLIDFYYIVKTKEWIAIQREKSTWIVVRLILTYLMESSRHQYVKI